MIGQLAQKVASRRQQRRVQQVPTTLDRHSMNALATLLVLAQFPHVFHLPVWVSVLGISLVLLKLYEGRKSNKVLTSLLSPLGMTAICIVSILLIRAQYGYFLGRDPCVAFLFVLVSAKFAEVRKPADATLLMCLAGFLLLTQYFYSQSILSAIITLPAVLALGNALIVLHSPNNAYPARQNITLVAKLLLQGAPLAALLFVVFPRLPGPLWSLPNDASATTGLSDSMSPGSISNLSQSDAVAFRVDFKGAIPRAAQRYWRGPVLSQYDGRRWSGNPNLFNVQPPSGAAAEIAYTVTLQPNNQRWLFALDNPSSLPGKPINESGAMQVLARLTNDLQLISDKPIKSAIRYSQRSTLGSYYRPARAPDTSMTQIPGNSPRTVRFAQQLRSQHPDDLDYANALLTWFNTENFRYTLQPSLLGDRPVDEFLFDTRNGFCEHYASAFVVALRAAAIPARVVTGYLGGEMNGDYMIVRQSDAHAWAEAYINGYWRRLDPTAAVAPSRVDQGMAGALPLGEPVPHMARPGNDWLKSLQLNWDQLNHDWQRLVVDFNNQSQRKLWEQLGLPKPQLWQITVLVLSITAIWCLLVLGLPLLRRRSGRTEEVLWQYYVDALSGFGVERFPSETPLDFISRAQREVVHRQFLIGELGKLLIQLRFKQSDQQAYDDTVTTIKPQLRQLRVQSWLASMSNRFRTTKESSA